MTTAPQRLFIGGAWTEPDHGHYEVINPATEQAVGLAPEASREQVYAAAAAAREAFPAWSRSRPEERAAILDRAADLMHRDFAANAALARAESGATTGTARSMQVAVGAARFRRYAKGALEPVEEAISPQINEAKPDGPGRCLRRGRRTPAGRRRHLHHLVQQSVGQPGKQVAPRWPWATRSS